MDEEEQVVETYSAEELLERAVKILQRVCQGYALSDTCQCVACEAGKFVNEII